MTFIVVVKEGPHGIIIVVTDKDIMGEKFSEGKLKLDLREKFYEGEEMELEEVVELLKSGSVFHLTGKEAVSLGIKIDLIDPKRVLVVNHVPHAEAVLGY